MTTTTPPTAAVFLPGTGSDADFISRALGPLAQTLKLRVFAVQPDPERLVESYLEALATAAEEHAQLVVGGVSIGAMVATAWALEHSDRVSAVVAAMPAWSGAAADSPAALSARHTAALLRADGLESTIATMRAGSPRWLADELERSWRALWPGLPASMDVAASYLAPTATQLATLEVPVALVAARDDPLHPIATAAQWRDALPHASLETVLLAELGADPAVLAAAGLRALSALKR